MTQQEIMVGILLDEKTTMSVVELCEYCHLSEEMLMDWLAHGLLGDVAPKPKQLQFDANMIARIISASRLHHDLEVNMQGVVLALDLLEEIASLRDELDILKRLIPKGNV